MNKRKILALICALALLFLSACSKNEEPVADATNEPEEVTETPEITEEPEPTEYTGARNPLTGEPVDEDISNNRPYAIMVNNLIEAQPQVGVSQADIIYEMPVEGGITRMLALFQDISGVGEIGTIRSSRPYYLDVAQGHDAIYVHAGGSSEAYSEISRRGVPNIDGVMGTGNEFYRDSERYANAGQEHSLMTSSDLLEEYIDSYGYRQEHEDGYSTGLTFVEDGTPEGGQAADTVTVVFSQYKTGVFEYDHETGLYMISQYGSEYIDGATGQQVGVTNVLVLNGSFSVIDSDGRLSTDLNTTGDGYFICGGQAVPITWSKAGYEEPFVYKLADGSQLELGVGKSYINIISQNGEVTIS